MFTQNVPASRLPSRLLGLLTGPHGVDRYTELVDPMWTSEDRATVVRVRRPNARNLTIWLRPNHPIVFRAGQYLTVTVEIDGRRHIRCYSPANAEGVPVIELTITRHDGGAVSEYLHRTARPGMTVGLSGPAGDFVLPDSRPRRLLLVAGGSGITPIMSMVRTLRQERGHDGEIAVLYYVRTAADACYREQLATLPDVRVLHVCTRTPGGDLHGHLNARHLATAMTHPDAVYVCGPHELIDATRQHYPGAIAESFAPVPAVNPDVPCGGRITFGESRIAVPDDGRTLLDQAEAAGLAPKTGCRMGICHTCTRRKVRGMVRNVTTGTISTQDDDAVQICVSVPVGDVEIDL